MNQHRPPRYRLAVFASGTGSNAQQIIHHFKTSALAQVTLIVSNKPQAGVLQIAARENIATLVIEKENFFRGDGYVPQLKAAGIDLIVLAGFLWKVPDALIQAFPRKIINIHPALLPKYGGKGMYGHFVHQAVKDARELQSGITIHYVDEHYDNGDIIFQTACSIDPTDDIATISKKVQQLEHRHYPQVIEAILKNS